MKPACKCRSNDRKWLEMCPEHFAEWQDTHNRWQAEHVDRNPDVQPVGNGVPYRDLFSEVPSV